MQPLLVYLQWDSKTVNELNDGLRMTFTLIEWRWVVEFASPKKYVNIVITVQNVNLKIVNSAHKFCYLLFMLEDRETNRDEICQLNYINIIYLKIRNVSK